MINLDNKIIDKQWLDKVNHAYKVYENQYGKQSNVEEFITWLYKQYGYVQPK